MNYLPVFPQPEVRMMLLSFAAREATHIAAYSNLVETLGMPDTIYNQFLEYDAMREKYEYVENFIGTDTESIAQQLAVFSAFTEGMQLFSSFIMLLNFPRHGTMVGMGSNISWSILDEKCLVAGTEVMTLDGWLPIECVTLSTELLEYDTETSQTNFVTPTNLTKKTVPTVYHFKGEGFSQSVSPNHRMILEMGDGRIQDVQAKDIESVTEEFSYVCSGTKSGSLKVLTDKHKELCRLTKEGVLSLEWVLPLLPIMDSSWAKEFLLEYMS
jgi:hypothetical protein